MKMRYLLAATLLVLVTWCGRISSTQLKPPPSGNFDLVAESVTYHPTNVMVGAPVVFDTVVRNAGTDKIPGGTYYVDLFLDGKNISFDHATSDIFPGADTKYSMSPGYHHFKPDKPGLYHYRFALDKEDNLPETDENNNVIEGTITVQATTEQSDGEATSEPTPDGAAPDASHP